MLKLSFYSLLVAAIFCVAFRSKQPVIPEHSIYGTVTGKSNKELIPFANLSLLRHDSVIQEVSSDANGNYCFKNVTQGIYKITAQYVGYSPKTISAISFHVKQMKLDITLDAGKMQLDEVEIKKSPKKDYEHKMKSAAREQVATHYAAPQNMRGGRVSYDRSNESDQEFNTENYNKIDDNEFKESVKHPLSTFSIDVDKASYSNIRRFIMQGQLPPADAVRVEEMINYFTLRLCSAKKRAPFSISTQYLNCPGIVNTISFMWQYKAKRLKKTICQPITWCFYWMFPGR